MNPQSSPFHAHHELQDYDIVDSSVGGGYQVLFHHQNHAADPYDEDQPEDRPVDIAPSITAKVPNKIG
ncbi:hypothetical protein ACJZ2D_014674 [Fusarium nematophilum]